MRVLFTMEMVVHVPTETGDTRTQSSMYVAPVGRKNLVRHPRASNTGRVGVYRDRFIPRGVILVC